MKYPVITHYKEAVLNVEDRLRTLSGMSAVLDKRGEPLFHASRGYVTFTVAVNGVHTLLRCFTTDDGYRRSVLWGTVFEHELYVFDDNQVGDYYSIMLGKVDATQSLNVVGEDNVAEDFAEGLSPFRSDSGKLGYRSNGKKRVVIRPRYDYAAEFSEGRAVVGAGGLFGLIDTEGHEVLAIEYDEVSWDGSSIAYVERGGKWGAWDRAARMIFECRYDWVGEYSHGLLLVRRQGKYGYVDVYGSEVIPLVYDGGTSFDENGIAAVIAAGLSRMIDIHGELLDM